MIADSSAWVEMLRQTGSRVDLLLQQVLRGNQRLLLPAVVYQEVLQGARNAQDFIRLQTQLDHVPRFEPEDLHEISRQAALLYARCRWRGFTPRSPNDCLIAACAIEAEEPLLHANRDFEILASIAPQLHLI
ncbi:PIN domain nuclease [soil metagenome]